MKKVKCISPSIALMAVCLLTTAPVTSAEPLCSVSEPDLEVAFAAGCHVKFEDRLLVVRHDDGGKLGWPAGFTKAGESAQCTAHRETWEETGVSVVVGDLAKRFENGFLLYHCDVEQLPESLAPGKDPDDEVEEVLWVDPNQRQASEWRFPRQHAEILRLFNQ